MTDPTRQKLLAALASAAQGGSIPGVRRCVLDALSYGVPAEEIAKSMTEYYAEPYAETYSGEEDITQLLLSARAIRSGMEMLRPRLQRNKDFYKYCAVIGTVAGDLHDLGKSLVGCLLESVGLTVVDLGIDVAAEQFCQALDAYDNVRFVGLSCLLSTTMNNVTKTIAVLDRHPKRKSFSIMVGGASISQEFADSVGADIYTNSATAAAQTVRRILSEMP